SPGVEVFATSRCARWDEAGTLRVPVACDRNQRVRRRTDQSATKPSLIGSEAFFPGGVSRFLASCVSFSREFGAWCEYRWSTPPLVRRKNGRQRRDRKRARP